MNFKKILSVLLCICLMLGAVLFIASCSDKNPQNDEPTEAPTTTPTETPTEKPTEAPTESVQDSTEGQTEGSTEESTEPQGETKIDYTVKVEDFDGNDVEGVNVEIYQGETLVASGKTDEKGKFVAQLVQSDDYTACLAETDGYIIDTEVLEFGSGKKLEFTVDMAVEYKITVLDQFTGSAISGIKVELYNSSEVLVATAITDENGVASIWAAERSYTVAFSDVPAKYPNEETYLLDSNEFTKTVYFADPADYEANGSRADTPLIVMNRDNVEVGAGKTLYCRAPRTPGFLLTVTNCNDNIVIVYAGTEYRAENGVIVVQFEEQLDESGNTVDKYYSAPNDFTIQNSGNSSATVRLSIIDASEALGTESNPFELTLGENITTPAFVIGTSLADPGISRYFYIFDAAEAGFFWVDTFDAAISVLLNGVLVQDDHYNPLPYLFVSAGDKIDVYIETQNLYDDATLPVSFIAGFDTTITEVPDRFTCEHVFDNLCDTECNKCGSERLPTHTEENISPVAATCSKTGLTVGVKCGVCQIILVEQEATDMLPHTEKTLTAVDPTCTETGLSVGKACSVCGTVTEAQQVIDALDHKWSNVYSYDENGHWQTCERECGAKTQSQSHALDENGLCDCGYGCDHSEVEWSVERDATCAEAGRKVASCKDCGKAVDSELIPLKDHTPGDAATCTSDQICTVCKKILDGAKGHAPGEAPTCTLAQKCTICEYVIADALGHTPGDKATCTTDQICTVCEEVLVEAGHTPNRDEATCQYQKMCIECFTVLEPFKDHVPGDEATCTEVQVCMSCGFTIAEAKGHSYGDDDMCVDCGAERPTYTYKVTIQNALTGAPLQGVEIKFYDVYTGDLVATLITDENGYVELVTKLCATADVHQSNLPDGYESEGILLGEESGFGFEYTIKLMHETDYIYDGRDDAHPYNIPGNGGTVTVQAGATIHCMYPKAAGLTMSVMAPEGVIIIYNGVEYKSTTGKILIRFEQEFDEEGNPISANYSEPCKFTIINTTGEAITLSPVVG